MCQLWGVWGLAERELEGARDQSISVTRRWSTTMNRATRKPGEHYTIWMTRKMPISVLERIRVLAAVNGLPMWKIHQQALIVGVKRIERRK